MPKPSKQHEKRIIAIIPARSGSKGVLKKNIRELGGYPLIAYSIAACVLSKRIERTIVSTDSSEIAVFARRYGAEVPFIRPEEYSTDSSTDIQWVNHAISWFQKTEGRMPSYIIHIRPTTPLRIPMEIDRAIGYMEARTDATSLRSIHELAEGPHKAFQLTGDGFLEGFFPDDTRPEYYNLPRQSFPKAYHPNGYVDVIKTDFVMRTGLLHGSRMLGFITPPVVEIDRVEDFEAAEYHLEKYGSPVRGHLVKNFSKAASYHERS
jgi:CMP-N,N'-diacetyllegionaminic acid synthase